jgi:hypothetical protein
LIFDAYVTALYKIKCSVSSDSPWYTISKLLLNSLYGRFGMSPLLDQNDTINIDDLNLYVKNSDIAVSETYDFGDKC